MTERAGPSERIRTLRRRRYARLGRVARTPGDDTVQWEDVSSVTPELDGQKRAANPIVPPRSVARRALLMLVAIMSFLACLCIAGVTIINDRAHGWERQIAEEVTIQVKPVDGTDTDQAVTRAAEIAMQTPGVQSANPLSKAAGSALLEPWLGRGFDASDLPIPRLIAVKVSNSVDLSALAGRLRDTVPSASLDDHGQWLQRLSSMARVMITAGGFIMGLVLAATALSVIFATRGAMAGNKQVIEVLHLVGAEDGYIAGQFQHHFLMLGLKGAALGGLAAVLLFAILGYFTGSEGITPEDAQLRSVFGGLHVGFTGYVGTILTILVIACIIAVTARATVRRTLRELN
ncbi:cell division transport system permease protein [Faunimonas pinastri]|uniref:Cell division transport system permease protein n=2 Tax=Faunimonas pinastri TaxID=1855383 RepID=A0A1H9HSV1_9HYPH|nr:cell division transport system permease protein [Faunimonas pinastri]